MKRVLIETGRAVLNVIYSLMKLRRVRNQVVFISRQSNAPSEDIMMIMRELSDRHIKSIALCRKLEGGMVNTLKYCLHMIKQMNCMSTSKVVVLDSYCIAASLLKQREETKLIQMWHALGAMKKFGLSILDKPEGRSSETARLMRMHANYDYIFTSSEKSRGAFAEAFGYAPEALTIMSLPRVDRLLDRDHDLELQTEILDAHPELANGRTNVLYVPTHRVGEDMTQAVRALIDAVDMTKFNLIIKTHPLTKLDINANEGVITGSRFTSVDMLAVSDAVITDYSAITYEIALKGIPVYFYAYDKESYLDGRSFYLDYDRDMPGPIFTDAVSLAEALLEGTDEEQ
ncbi:MAG: CDP-glycerol glycerophosphotransferase family protein, partial [Clostridiales bacterium]|nr:CDP-glycerol glycerophosphotransferase family protein [Clostridiales bacterium]